MSLYFNFNYLQKPALLQSPFLHSFEIARFTNIFFTQMMAVVEDEFQLVTTDLIHEILKIHFFYKNFLFQHESKNKFFYNSNLAVSHRNLCAQQQNSIGGIM